MCAIVVDIQSATAEIRRGKTKKERSKKQDKNIMSASATQGGHNKYTQIMYCSHSAAYTMGVILFCLLDVGLLPVNAAMC